MASGSVLSKLTLYVQLSKTDAQGCEIALEGLDKNNVVTQAKSAYSDVGGYADSTGYQYRGVFENMPERYALYIRPKSNPNGEVRVVYDRPIASQPRTRVYPPSGSADLKTPYPYVGTKTGGLPSNNTAVVNLTYDFVNGRITNIRPNNSQGGTVVAKISNHIYRWNPDNGGQWFRVNQYTGATGGSAVAFSLSPQYAHLFNVFLVDTSRPINGSDNVPGWFDQPVTVGTQLLRVL